MHFGSLILIVIGVGLLIWLMHTFIPLPAKYQQLVDVLAGIFVFLYILQSVGLIPTLVHF